MRVKVLNYYGETTQVIQNFEEPYCLRIFLIEFYFWEW